MRKILVYNERELDYRGVACGDSGEIISLISRGYLVLNYLGLLLWLVAMPVQQYSVFSISRFSMR